jgi:septin 3/9/12
MAEMNHHQIRLYPFDADELDDEELSLNERIRVSYSFLLVSTRHRGRTSADV